MIHSSAAVVPRATVLVVDDDPLMRQTTARILKKADYFVVQAATADEARSQWREHRPEVAARLDKGG